MGKLNKIEIIFAGEKGKAFEPGQLMAGIVRIEATEHIKAKEVRLELSGKASVYWSDDKTDYSDDEPYFDYSIVLLASGNSEKELIIERGVHEHPFKFQLPTDLPSTFEGSMGEIRYKAKVIVQRPLRFDDVKESSFAVTRPLDLNEEPLALRAPIIIQSQKVMTCCCIIGGIVEIDLLTNRACFIPGEEITFNGHVVNRTSRDIAQITARLLLNTAYCVRHSDGRQFRSNSTLDEEVSKVTRPRLRSGQTDIWDDVRLPVPRTSESRMDGCSIISTSYFMEVSVRFQGDFRRESLGKQLVLIGNVPLKSNVVIVPSDDEKEERSSGDEEEEDENEKKRQKETASIDIKEETKDYESSEKQKEPDDHQTEAKNHTQNSGKSEFKVEDIQSMTRNGMIEEVVFESIQLKSLAK